MLDPNHGTGFFWRGMGKSVETCYKLHAQIKLLAIRFYYTITCVWSRYVALLYALKTIFLFISPLRFSLMLRVYGKNYIFLVVFVWLAWLLPKYKNSLFFFFFKSCVANNKFELRGSHQRCSIKKLFLEILQHSMLLQCSI